MGAPVLRQFSWIAGGRLVAAGLLAVSYVLVARQVSPAEFGRLAAVLGLATVAQTATEFGVGTFVSRERAANSASGLIAVALRLNAITSVGLVFLFGVSLCLAGVVGSDSFFLMLPIAFAISAERIADTRLVVAFADGDAWINTTNLVGRRLTALLLFVILTYVAVNPVFAFGVASACAAAVSALVAHVLIGRRVSQAVGSVKDVLRESWPYWLNSVATQARNLDTALIAACTTSATAGYYASASRLTSPLRLLPTSMASVLLPAATRARSAGTSLKAVHVAAWWMIVGISVAYAALGLAVPLILPMLLGSAYGSSTLPAQIVIFSLPAAAVVSISGVLLQAQGRKHLVSTVATVSTILFLVVVAIGAITWGATGAAAALAGSFVLHALVLAMIYLKTNRVEAST